MSLQAAQRTVPLKPDFGVEMPDVDLADASPALLSEVINTFQRNGAIVLRNQKLDQQAQIAFTKLFGEPAENSRPEYCDQDYPEIYIISNKVVNGRGIGDPDAGQGCPTH